MLKKLTKCGRKLKAFFCFLVIGRFKRVLFVDTPTHGNLGDHAIALASMQVLEQYFETKDIYEIAAEEINGLEKIYAFFARTKQILIVPGGGFLGTLWLAEENRFRNIVKAFSKQKIVVFPQTVYFETDTDYGQQMLKESQKIYAEHQNLTLFVREQSSFLFMKEFFPNVKTFLVPDIVAWMKYIPKQMPERQGVLLCMRKDKEKTLSEPLQNRMLSVLKSYFPESDVTWTDTDGPDNFYRKKRYQAVSGKLEQFAGARLIVTDRLHGMIFAAITGSPCIAFNNKSNKVKGVYEWIKNNKYLRFVNEIEEFETAVSDMELDRAHTFNREKVLQDFEPLFCELIRCTEK